MSNYQQPSEEWVATEVLRHASGVFHYRCFNRFKPLVRFRYPDLGPDVFVELMPSMALAVRNEATGELLSMSKPLDFKKLNFEGLTNEAALSALVQAKSRAISPQASEPKDKAY